MVIHLNPGRPRIETTQRGRLLATAMTEVAAPYMETNPRRRAEENIVNTTVKKFAVEVNEFIENEIGSQHSTIAPSTMYKRTSYT